MDKMRKETLAKQVAECGATSNPKSSKEYNQVDKLLMENSELREVIQDQKEELLNLYRSRYIVQDRPSY